MIQNEYWSVGTRRVVRHCLLISLPMVRSIHVHSVRARETAARRRYVVSPLSRIAIIASTSDGGTSYGTLGRARPHHTNNPYYPSFPQFTRSNGFTLLTTTTFTFFFPSFRLFRILEETTRREIFSSDILRESRGNPLLRHFYRRTLTLCNIHPCISSNFSFFLTRTKLTQPHTLSIVLLFSSFLSTHTTHTHTRTYAPSFSLSHSFSAHFSHLFPSQQTITISYSSVSFLSCNLAQSLVSNCSRSRFCFSLS